MESRQTSRTDIRESPRNPAVLGGRSPPKIWTIFKIGKGIVQKAIDRVKHSKPCAALTVATIRLSGAPRSTRSGMQPAILRSGSN